MILKEITLIQRQLQKHKANHGQFTIEVARLELVHTETYVKLRDLLRTSGLGSNQQGSEEHYFQALRQRYSQAEETDISGRKTVSALQPAHRSGCVAPGPRLLVPGPAPLRQSFGTVNTGP